jgi:hypothetical protein
LNRRIIILTLFLFSLTVANAQSRFSLSTDVSALRSLKKGQRYWAAAHTTILNFHITQKDGIYVWLAYTVGGRFKNSLVANAKTALITPQQISYTNTSVMKLKTLSIGWKKYLKGAPDAETKWNLYGTAGFGLLFGNVTNTRSVIIDTSQYNVPIQDGSAHFKRLTLDLGLGAEWPIGGDLYLYSEARTWIPTPGYPSSYILVNDHTPLTGLVCIGLRLLF